MAEPMTAQPAHQSVLYHEIIHALTPVTPGRYVDGTLGAGGHAWGILQASSPEGSLLGMDLDPNAMILSRERLAEFGNRVHLVQASYATLAVQLSTLGWESVQGILLDLGVSSMQLDGAERGFSFLQDGPLDMRFDPSNPRTAADLVNGLPEAELAALIWRYGEEPHSHRIARAICSARPIHRTGELAAVIARATGRTRNRLNPATLTFQALRIALNGELEALESFLPQAKQALSPGGRMAIISFHSLEDRLVKEFYRRESRDCICPPEQPVCTCGHKASLKVLTHKPIMAGEKEKEGNPRARSARLRVAEKLHGI